MMKLYSIYKFIVKHPLSKGRTLSAFYDFIKWQLGTRLLGSKLVVKWVNDSKFITGKGEEGLTGNLYCGLMEFEDMCFLLHCLRSTDEFYDIGANVGAYTILASAVIGCKSYSFEPLPDTFDRFVDQIHVNRIEGLVDARNCGIGAETDVLEFTNSLNCMNKVNIDKDNKDVTEVSVIALDNEFSPNQNTIVKIDVEGYERFVLEGGKLFFASQNVNALIVELNGSGEQFSTTDVEVDLTIRSFGFFPVNYDPISRSLHKIESYNVGGNTIYVKDINMFIERCKLADKFIVHTAGAIHI